MRAPLAAALAFQLPLAVFLAWRQAAMLDPDQLAAVLMAKHWIAGRFELAISGVWAPLASWSLAPLLALGAPALAACRGLLVITSLFHTAGAARVLERLRVPDNIAGIFLVSVAVHGAVWCACYFNGDLMLSTALAWLLAELLRDEASGGPRPWCAGVLGAVAYLSKAAGLPLAASAVILAALIRGRHTWRHAARSLTWMGALVLPWMLTLSVHYGHPTLSDAGRVNRAILGPALSGPEPKLDMGRAHPAFSTLHVPRPGRITAWEDPAETHYPDWNPLATSEDRARQWAFTYRALKESVMVLFRVDRLGVGLLALLVVTVSALRRPREGVGRMDLLPVAMVASNVLLYAPFFTSYRYLWPSHLPLLVITAVAATRLLREGGEEPPGRVRRLAVLGLGVPALLSGLFLAMVFTVIPPWSQAEHARRLVESAGALPGVTAAASWPLAEDTWPNLTGMYVASEVGVPWHGMAPASAVGPGKARASGVDLLVSAEEIEDDDPGSARPPPGWKEVASLETQDWSFAILGNWRYRLLVPVEKALDR